MSLNKVLLIGNVGKDPDVRYLENNTKVASFTLATTERYRDKNNELKEITEWHNIVCWRRSADIVEQYVKKGTQLFIEGRLRTRNWDDQNGIKHYVTEINADNIQLLGRKQDNPAAAPGMAPQAQQASQAFQPSQAAQAPQQARQSEPLNIEPEEDDLPF